jgi:uncharacterized protein (TIGR00251 family)
VVALADGDQALAIQIAAPPVDGAANAALLAFLSKLLAVSKTDLVLAAGEASRLKRIRIYGDPQNLAQAIRALAPVSKDAC